MSKKSADDLVTTVQVRLYTTPEQSHLLMTHCQEYISTVNMLVQAQELEILPSKVSCKDFMALLPSVLKDQALRDAQSIYKKSVKLGVTPILKKPICQWNNQNWHLTDCTLTIPIYIDGKVKRISIACHGLVYSGKAGILRIKKKRGRWIADITLSHATPASVESERVMGIDLGIKVPAVSYTPGYGTRFYGNGRYQRHMRRRFYAHRKKLQKAKKTRAVRKSKGKEQRWMRDVNHKLSRQIVNNAHANGVGVIKVESLTGIREGTTRKSRGAKARKNNRMKNTWPYYQLTLFITYKAAHLGIRVEQVDPAYTSQECPACGCRNKAHDRAYICSDCGWIGHRDKVGAINISRRTGLSDKRIGATGA